MKTKIILFLFGAAVFTSCQTNVETDDTAVVVDTVDVFAQERDEYVTTTTTTITTYSTRVSELDAKIQATKDPKKKQQYTAERDSIIYVIKEIEVDLEKAKVETDKDRWVNAKGKVSSGVDKVTSRIDSLSTRINNDDKTDK